jgi:cutinase
MATITASHKAARLAAGIAASLLLTAATAAVPSAHAQTAYAQNGCAAVDIVVARGTGESGYLGAQVGDPLYAQLRQTLSVSSTAYRVNYPATLAVSSPGAGVRNLVAHLSEQAAACPNQRFVVVGYSQGAFVVQDALGAGIRLPGTTTVAARPASRIAAVLLFGDPIRLLGRAVHGPWAGRIDDVCATGDPICQLGGLNPAAHVRYAYDLRSAADYAASRL